MGLARFHGQNGHAGMSDNLFCTALVLVNELATCWCITNLLYNVLLMIYIIVLNIPKQYYLGMAR